MLMRDADDAGDTIGNGFVFDAPGYVLKSVAALAVCGT